MTIPLRRVAGSSRRSDAWALVGLLGLAVLLPVVIGALAGSLDIPRNDDWSFRRIALRLAESGRLELDGIAAPLLVGQVVVVQPLLWLSDLQPWAFTVAGILFAGSAALGAFALARTVLPSGLAALAVLSLVLFPGFLAYDVSFMSDVPALGAELACLALGMLAIRQGPVRTGWLLASMAAGILAFSIREVAVVAPAAVLLAAMIADRGRRTVWATVIGVLACCATIYLWRASLPGQIPPATLGQGGLSKPVRAFSSIALAIAPAAFVGAARWRHHVRRLDLGIGLAVGILVAAGPLLELVQDRSLPTVILGNPTSQAGALPTRYLIGARPPLFSRAEWTAFNGLALIATVAVLTLGIAIAGAHLRRSGRSPRALVERVGSPAGILLLFSLATMGGLSLYGLVGRLLYERYFWPLAVPVAILFLYRPRGLEPPRPARRQWTVDLGLIGSATGYGLMLGVVSVALLFNGAAFDSARWSAGEQLVRAGIPADRIDAGYEWVGYHATTPGDPRRDFYRSWWPGFSPCAIVSSEAVDQSGYTLLGTTTYRTRLVSGPTVTLYEYRVASAACQSAG